MATRCTALTTSGRRCRAWAIPGTNPPRCVAHARAEPTGRPPTHGFYAKPRKPPEDTADINQVIADLATKQAQLSAYIDTCLAQGRDLTALAHLLALHAQNASRLGRLLRDKKALSGEAADGLSDAIAVALDEIATLRGTDL